MISIYLFILLSNPLSFVDFSDQRPDFLTIADYTFEMSTFPLEEYPSVYRTRLDSFIRKNNNACTGCHRGYQAIWSVQGDSLFLLKIKECCYLPINVISDYNLRVLKIKGVPDDILEKLKGLDFHRAYNFTEIKDMLYEHFKKKYVKKYLSTVDKYTLEMEDSISADRLSGVQGENGVFSDWYSGKLYYKKDKIEFVFIMKEGIVVNKLLRDDLSTYPEELLYK